MFHKEQFEIENINENNYAKVNNLFEFKNLYVHVSKLTHPHRTTSTAKFTNHVDR